MPGILAVIAEFVQLMTKRLLCIWWVHAVPQGQNSLHCIAMFDYLASMVPRDSLTLPSDFQSLQQLFDQRPSLFVPFCMLQLW